MADRYHELMAFRQETLSRHGANEMSVFAGPRPHLTLPRLGFGAGPAKKRIGPLRFNERWPLLPFVDKIVAASSRPLVVLEIGPGRGEFAGAIREKHGPRIGAYYAYDRDPTVRGPYVRLDKLGDVPDGVDLVIASEVIEHMSADELYQNLFSAVVPKLSAGAAFVASTPNPLAPGGIARDFSHQQRYPWYDLYAIFRLFFEEVEIRRSFYLFDAKRVVQLVPRFVLCSLLELEWCDGLIAVARRPRPNEIGS